MDQRNKDQKDRINELSTEQMHRVRGGVGGGAYGGGAPRVGGGGGGYGGGLRGGGAVWDPVAGQREPTSAPVLKPAAGQ